MAGQKRTHATHQCPPEAVRMQNTDLFMLTVWYILVGLLQKHQLYMPFGLKTSILLIRGAGQFLLHFGRAPSKAPAIQAFWDQNIYFEH